MFRALPQPIKKAIKQATIYPYYQIRGSRPLWKLLIGKARKLYKKYPPSLEDKAQEVARVLKKEGVHTIHINDLFPEGHDFKEIQTEANRLLSNASVLSRKNFFLDIWDENKFPADLNNPFLRLALNEKLLGIAAEYLGFYPKLHSSRAMQTTISKGAEPTMSQLWHRDLDDKRICKIFLLLNDVDELTGPFNYVRGSNYGNKWGNLFPQTTPFGQYEGRIPDENVKKYVPQSDIKVATGPAGTLLFADTTGIHKGGYSLEKPRFTFLISYRSPMPFTRISKRHKFIFPENWDEQKQKLSRIQRYALEWSKFDIP